MHWLKVVAPLLAVATFGLCARDMLHHDEPTAPPPPLPARPASEPGLHREAARTALERDAFRREDRFAAAVDPDTAWQALRLEASDVGARTSQQLFTLGERLFSHTFRREEGFGSRQQGIPRRVQGPDGGPDAHRCVDCHHRGGPAGAGGLSDHSYLGDGQRPQAAIVRNPPSLVGAGVVAQLAREMTASLKRQRSDALRRAASDGVDQRVELSAKGVGFGVLIARPDGTYDVRELDGVDGDLVVKPFGWSGHTADLRAMVEDQLARHHGMQSRVVGPEDADGDGVPHEITEGQLIALTAYVALQEIPVADMPAAPSLVEAWARGQRHFEAFGCADCHRPSMVLDDPVLRLPPRDGAPAVALDLREGAEPRLPDGEPLEVHLYSDLKRHVVGPNLRDAQSHRGVSPASFLTPPLWGLARSAPYLHDGRAPTIHDAIAAHSGEANASRQKYEEAHVDARGELRVYLLSLTRAPRFVTE